MLNGKTVTLGVTGGIAAYKAVDVVSRLVKLGADVRVCMTESAQKLVTPLTFQTISKNAVATDPFLPVRNFEIDHISLADSDAILIAPATANVIGKIASGIADDLVTTTVMAARGPVLIAPAMNVKMWENPIVQRNLTTLRELGYIIIEPTVGRLACGVIGAGKLADPSDIVNAVIGALFGPRDFTDQNVLITAGPTREAIDPVRHITNASSGKMGYALARAANSRGANVTLVSGSTALPDPPGIKIIRVTSAADMYEAVMACRENADIIIKTAAVADFTPSENYDNKVKKADIGLQIDLEPTKDILKELGQSPHTAKLVGFCMETQDLIANAEQKLISKNLDMIVANDLFTENAGFESDSNKVTIITKTSREDMPHMPKIALAHEILDRIKKL